MDSAPYPTRAPIAPPGGPKVNFTPSAPPPPKPYSSATVAPSQPVSSVPTSSIPSASSPSTSPTLPLPQQPEEPQQIAQNPALPSSPIFSDNFDTTAIPIPKTPHSDPTFVDQNTTSYIKPSQSDSPPTTPVYAPPPSTSRKFPLMIITMILLTVLGVLGGYFAFASITKPQVTNQAFVPATVFPTQVKNSDTSFSNPFAAPTVAYQNPFAESETDYDNPFGTYENPFAVAESDATEDTLGVYKNPFE